MDKLIITTRQELQEIVQEAMQPQPPTEQPSKKLYTKAEVQQLFKVAMPTIDRWSKQGKLKRIKVGNRVYFNASEVENLLG